jgi:CMP-N,N'-diacetyllegionaminic acid synthase
MNVVALIPARSGSVGLKNKNIKIFNKKPLIWYAINSAKQSKIIKKIFVTTDSKKIANISKICGADIPFLRPKKYSTSTSTDLDVIRHFIKKTKYKNIDAIVFLRPTNPFRTGKDIDHCIQKYFANKKKLDSVRSISKVSYPPFWMKKIHKFSLKDLFPSKLSNMRRQDLPRVYKGNGAIEIIGSCVLSKLNTRFGKRIGYCMMPDLCSFDIDTFLDFKISEYVFKNFFFKTYNNNRLNVIK